MKKVILAIALVVGGLTTYAQETETEKEDMNATSVETEVTVEEEAAAQDQDTYQEIAVEELPEAVSSAVEKSYPTASIDKAYINDEQEYKLQVSLNDGTVGTLYADAEGNWIE
jgi:hypothetical protein